MFDFLKEYFVYLIVPVILILYVSNVGLNCLKEKTCKHVDFDRVEEDKVKKIIGSANIKYNNKDCILYEVHDLQVNGRYYIDCKEK